MKDFSSKVYKAFNSEVIALDRVKQEMKLVNDPEKDFTRLRKLDFSDLIKIIVLSSGAPIKDELNRYYDYDPEVISTSGFVQARDKIRPEAFEYLLKRLNLRFTADKRFRGYRLVGVDGCDLSIAFDPFDEYTYYHLGENKKGCSILHLNVSYDILNHRYLDNILQGVKDKDEPLAMYTMAERSDDKAIYIADRMYPTLNNMEHLKKAGKKFVIRLKDIHSPISFFHKFDLPEDEEFDKDVSITLTCRQTKETKAHPERYRWVNSSQNFDFLSKENPYYEVSYRVVAFKLDTGNYEYLVSNLQRDSFSLSDLKYLYRLRWAHEVSYRHLKYSENMCSLHARKRSSIRQEIFAKMVLYNLCMIIIESLSEKARRKSTKYAYVINITRASHIIRDNFRKRKGGIPPGREALICRELLPVRPDRKYPRNVKPHSAICFNYRFS